MIERRLGVFARGIVGVFPEDSHPPIPIPSR